MDVVDDDLERFAAHGAALPAGGEAGTVEHDGARIWYATHGTGPAVVLLHGGMGHGGNWAHQVPAIVASGRRAIVIDSRGHGHSTRDARPFSYRLMASDVLAVMDALGLQSSPIVGWSDGACIGLVLARREPGRVAGLFFFACNVDPTGTRPFVMTPIIQHCITRHRLDYAALSPTPGGFDALGADLQPMQRDEPNYGPEELAAIRVPVTVVQSEHDEFIERSHAEHIARSIPGARLVLLEGVSHFAPLQRPAVFNRAMLAFLDGLSAAVGPETRRGEGTERKDIAS